MLTLIANEMNAGATVHKRSVAVTHSNGRAVVLRLKNAHDEGRRMKEIHSIERQQYFHDKRARHLPSLNAANKVLALPSPSSKYELA